MRVITTKLRSQIESLNPPSELRFDPINDQTKEGAVKLHLPTGTPGDPHAHCLPKSDVRLYEAAKILAKKNSILGIEISVEDFPDTPQLFELTSIVNGKDQAEVAIRRMVKTRMEIWRLILEGAERDAKSVFNFPLKDAE